jgi:hypothetical protein
MSFNPAPLIVDEVQDPRWLSWALSQGRDPVTVNAVKVVETLGPSCLKVRLELEFAKQPVDVPKNLCFKGIFNPKLPEYLASGVQETEANFYRYNAPKLTVRVPPSVYAGVDPATKAGVIVMHDMVAKGGKFLTALSPYTSVQAHRSLDQLARLHGGSWNADVSKMPWIRERLTWIVNSGTVPAAKITDMMNGERGLPLTKDLYSGERIYAAVTALAKRNESLPGCFVHGDCHAGNVFEIDGEIGLCDWQVLQTGHWSIDAAYHIGAALSVEDRRKHEVELLKHYLDCLARHGGPTVPWDTAWAQYQEAVAYGFMMWAMTQRVDPAITHEFVKRLGTAVMDHETFKKLGV